ncbi:hypothetical protein LZ32DRAFT_323570 [Colletotrichum eremochloae]|nr:hypothetical protein LZ32DRAFT_323570 [Colletotrichum eremochloae]
MMAKRGSQAIDMDAERAEVYEYLVVECRKKTCEPCHFRDKSGSLSSSPGPSPPLALTTGTGHQLVRLLFRTYCTAYVGMVLWSFQSLFLSLQPSFRHLFLSHPNYSLRKPQSLSASTVESVSILLFPFSW